MHSKAFNTAIEHLIQKHHVNNGNPTERFNYLKNIAKQFNFSNNIKGKVIQIAGTNGKGSTQQFLWQLLKSNGYRCHVFRSPHLVTINERIILNNEMISDTLLLEKLHWADQLVDQPIGFFALLSLAFFKCCLEQSADFILLETGLGGEFDATNILEDHALSLITPISYDHCDILGHDLTNIAKAKAGIMRADQQCFSAPQAAEAKAVLTQHAANLKTPISFLEDNNFKTLADGFSLNNQNYTTPGLAGEHQKENAALAIAVYQYLINPRQQLNLKEINHTLQNTHFTGRLHPAESGHLTKQLQYPLWVDGAHNPAGVGNLINFIKTTDEPIYFWLNFKSNKDIKTIFEILKPYSNTIILQITEQQDRACKKDMTAITDLLGIQINYSDSIEESIQLFNKQPKGLVLAFGSLHWIGKLLQLNKH
jgi:dihydrofolate synthase/folylpolyglutamate synthase